MLTAAGFALDLGMTAIDTYDIPVLLETGLQLKYASMIWAISPVLDFFIDSYLGSVSDRCQCSWGRRRPFILGWALIAAPCLAVLAWGHGYSVVSFYIIPIAFVVADFALESLEYPLRMYLMDSVPLEMNDKANYLLSAMLALGSLCASLLGVVNWEKINRSPDSDSNQTAISRTRTTKSVTYQTHVIFEVAFFVFAACALITLFSVKEKRRRRTESGSDDSDSSDSSDSSESSSSDSESEVSTIDVGLLLFPEPGSVEDGIIANGEVQPKTSLEGNSLASESKQQSCGVVCNKPSEKYMYCICNWLREVYKSMQSMWEFSKYISNPTLMLMLMTFFDWFVLLSTDLFFSDYVGRVIYKGSPGDNEELNLLYAEGVRMSCWCEVLEDSVTFVYTLSLGWISKYVSHTYLLLAGHLSFLITLGLALFTENLFALFLLCIAEGVLYGNMESIPYALIPYYKVSTIFHACSSIHLLHTQSIPLCSISYYIILNPKREYTQL